MEITMRILTLIVMAISLMGCGPEADKGPENNAQATNNRAGTNNSNNTNGGNNVMDVTMQPGGDSLHTLYAEMLLHACVKGNGFCIPEDLQQAGSLVKSLGGGECELRHALEVAMLPIYEGGMVLRRVSDGRAEIIPVEVKGCLAASRQAALVPRDMCDADLYEAWLCEQAIRGTVPDGGACEVNNDCAKTAACVVTSEVACGGTCMSFDTYQSHRGCWLETCGPDSFCGDNGCTPKLQVGEACPSNTWALDELMRPCVNTAFCNEDLVCEQRLAANARCDNSFGTRSVCAEGLYCTPSAVETCKPIGELGDRCPCGPGLQCGEDYTCIPLSQDGEPCSSPSDCALDLVCNDSQGVCQKSVGDELCYRDSQCADGLSCGDLRARQTNRCHAAFDRTQGSECFGDHQCADGLYCKKGTCEDSQLAENETCERSEDCAAPLVCKRVDSDLPMGLCKQPEPREGAVFKPRVGRDQPCDEWTACEEAFFCTEVVVQQDPEVMEFRCVDRLPDFEPCNHTRDCQVGSYCSYETQTCTPTVDDGEACIYHWQCKSNICDQATCGPRQCGELLDRCDDLGGNGLCRGEG